MADESKNDRDAVQSYVAAIELRLNKLAKRWRKLQVPQNPVPEVKEEAGNIEAVFDQLESHDWSLKKRAY